MSVLNALIAQEWSTSVAVVVIVEASVEGAFVVGSLAVAVDDVAVVAAEAAENSRNWY